MALIPSNPISRALTIVEGGEKAEKFAVTDPTGTLLDFTGFNTATLTIMTDGALAIVLDSESVAISAADATGVTVNVDPTLTATIKAIIGSLRVAYKLVVGDGTDTVNAAYGLFQLNLTGL